MVPAYQVPFRRFALVMKKSLFSSNVFFLLMFIETHTLSWKFMVCKLYYYTTKCIPQKPKSV